MYGNNNFYQQQATQVPYYYQSNEVLHPDYRTYPTTQNFSSAYQGYNFDPYSYATNNQNGFQAYNPATTSASNVQKVVAAQVPEPVDFESILKKNPEVWEAYKTGNFDVEEVIENKTRRIILKEKGSTNKDYEYTVKKYKMNVQNSEHDQVVKKEQEDGQSLLQASYSSNSLKTNNQAQQKVISSAASPALSYNSVVEQKPVQAEQVFQYQQPVAQYYLQPQYFPQQQQQQQQQIIHQELPQTQRVVQTTSGNSYYQPSFSQPGSELIQKIIDGDDKNFEYLVPEVLELVGSFLVYPKQNKTRTETPKKLQTDASVFSESDSNDDDNPRSIKSKSRSSFSGGSSVRSIKVSSRTVTPLKI